MAQIKLDGHPARTCGDLPAVGAAAPAFRLFDTHLTARTLQEFLGKPLVLNIFPSIETPVCSAAVRRFNGIAATHAGAAVLCISADLPFAQARFCGAAGIDGVVMLSTYRSPEFGTDYGIAVTEGAFTGLLARAVLVVDETGTVVHAELVADIGHEPDYEAAVAALAGLAG